MNLYFHLLVVFSLVWSSAGQGKLLEIEPSIMYVNSNVEVIHRYQDCDVHVVSMCKFYAGYTANIKVFHNHNPQNDVRDGITSIFVGTTEPTACDQQFKADLCSVHWNDPNYKPECSGKVLSNVTQLFVKVNGTRAANINYAISVTFERNPVPGNRVQHLPKVRLPDPVFPLRPSPRLGGALMKDVLNPVVNYEGQIDLEYKEAALITLNFCPHDHLKKMVVNTIFQADDAKGESLISQAICKQRACDMNSDNIGVNYDNLPVNTLSSSTTDVATVYVYGLAFGGPLDPAKKTPKGSFRFGATIDPM